MERSHGKKHAAGKGSSQRRGPPRSQDASARSRPASGAVSGKKKHVPDRREDAPRSQPGGARRKGDNQRQPRSGGGRNATERGRVSRPRKGSSRKRAVSAGAPADAPAGAQEPAPRKRRTVHRKLAPVAENRQEIVHGESPPAALAEPALLEQRLGHSFADPGLLRRALTHSSASADNYERLEFLGDAALGFVVARLLFEDMPDATEQRLTLMRTHVVSAAALVEVARKLELGRFLVLGAGERRTGGVDRPSILGDALEAVLGAVLCDGGLKAAVECVRRLFASRLATAQGADLKDPKTRLQEHLQQSGLALPSYEITAAGGLAHAPVYAVECVVEALGVRAQGVAGSRREAEKQAAARALAELESATSPRGNRQRSSSVEVA